MADTTTIVVLAALQQQAEDAAVAADPESGAGTFVPGVDLRKAGDDTNTVVAYWARWIMKAGQQSAFAQALGGPINIIGVGGNVDLSRDRWIFDSNDGAWEAQQVLDALGLDRPYNPGM